MPGRSWLGCRCQRQHSGTRDRNHHLPILLIQQKQDWRQRCCLSVRNLSLINLGEICSAAVSEPGSDKHSTASFPAVWGDEWLELEALPGDLWQKLAFYPLASTQYYASHASLLLLIIKLHLSNWRETKLGNWFQVEVVPGSNRMVPRKPGFWKGGGSNTEKTHYNV